MSRLHASVVFMIGLIGLVTAGCFGGTAQVRVVHAQAPLQAPDSVDHTAWANVLQTYVDTTGAVDYARLTADADSVLLPYLRTLASTDPARLSRDARLAFWLNAYNAYTLKLITDHYPVASIKDITPGAGPSIPKVNSPFVLDVGAVADTVRTLDAIEHDIIRERFDEPRIHFALVCAAWSCPRLRREPYTGAALDRQLDDQARTFLHDTVKNRVPDGANRVALSRIFKWFDDDFGGSRDAIQRFIAPYFDGTVADRLSRADYTVDFLSYDWTLNASSTHAPSTATH